MGEIIKTVKLTDDQFDRLWRDRVSIKLIGKVLGQAIKEATELAAEQEQDFWKAVETAADASIYTNRVSIDWANRQIVVKEQAKGGE